MLDRPVPRSRHPFDGRLEELEFLVQLAIGVQQRRDLGLQPKPADLTAWGSTEESVTRMSVPSLSSAIL